MRVISQQLRDSARGQECQVRIPDVCNGNPDTVVLAHYRMAGTCGTGIKPPDFMASWCCSSCHDVLDGRQKNDLPKTVKDLMHLEGVMRTQQHWIAKGLITVRGMK